LDSWSTRHVHVLETEEHCSTAIVLQRGPACISMSYTLAGGQTCVLPPAVRKQADKKHSEHGGPGGRRECTGSPFLHLQLLTTLRRAQ
jgi:hypothetical protein